MKILLQSILVFIIGFAILFLIGLTFPESYSVAESILTHIFLAILYLASIVWLIGSRILEEMKNR